MLIIILLLITIIIIISIYQNQNNLTKKNKKFKFFIFFLLNLIFVFVIYLKKELFFVLINVKADSKKGYSIEQIRLKLVNHKNLLLLIEKTNEENKKYFYDKFFNEKTKISQEQLLEEIQLIQETLDEILIKAQKKPELLQNKYIFTLKNTNLLIYYENDFPNLEIENYYNLVQIYVHVVALLSLTKKIFNL